MLIAFQLTTRNKSTSKAIKNNIQITNLLKKGTLKRNFYKKNTFNFRD